MFFLEGQRTNHRLNRGTKNQSLSISSGENRKKYPLFGEVDYTLGILLQQGDPAIQAKDLEWAEVKLIEYMIFQKEMAEPLRINEINDKEIISGFSLTWRICCTVSRGGAV